MKINGPIQTPKMFLQPRRMDKKTVLNALGHFDGFHVGASMPSPFVSFVQDVGKPFFIDPMVYMFALSPDHVLEQETKKIRQSMSTLAKIYSPFLTKIIGKTALTPDDVMQSRSLLEEITHNSLEYQRHKFEPEQPALINRYFDKYDAFESESGVEHTVQASEPSLLMAPFFYVSGISDSWYKVGLQCARLATEHRKLGEQLYVTIFINKETLEDLSQIQRIALDYSSLESDGVILWVNGLNEESAPPAQLSNLLYLVAGIRKSGKSVIKLYGGFLSIMMYARGLSAFSCSLSYGTSRDVFAYKWIAPKPASPKFYIPGLHKAYSLEEASHVLKIFPFLRCNCAVCRGSYGEDMNRFSDEMKKDGYCQNHFLNARKRELEYFSRSGIEGALSEINETLERLHKKNAKGARHLTKWRDVFSTGKPVSLGADPFLKRIFSRSMPLI